MHLTIVLRKEIPDKDTGQVLFEFVKSKLTDYPEVQISGQVNETLDNEE